MKIIEIKNRDTILINQLFNVWEKSVKMSHLFLSTIEINNIAKIIPEALNNISNLIVALDNDKPIAFMGIDKNKLEMLFILPQYQSKGLGRQLIAYAIQEYSINEVSVNEQNTKARAFYEHLDFYIYKRSTLDEQGMPYPILYMKLKNQ